MNIDKAVVEKLDTYLARGLCDGIGSPDGQVCVEAAIALATGEPFSDEPSCVSKAVRSYSIELNDMPYWVSPESRASGTRELAIAQLGSAGAVDDKVFSARMSELTIRELIPSLFRSVPPANPGMLAAADHCELEGSEQSARVAASAAYAYYAYYAVADGAAASASYAADDAASVAGYAASAAASVAGYAAYAASYYAAYDAAAGPGVGERFLLQSAAIAVRVLRELGSPGCALLDGGKS